MLKRPQEEMHDSSPGRPASSGRVDIRAYLAEARELTIEEIRRLVPRDERYGRILYDLALDYPLREAKALRPALCIAACRALGGGLEAVLPSAAVLELYHNAFLIHDDVEDSSERRRDRETLHRSHGVPIAVNVGDAMLALALRPLLDNMRHVGLGKALRILQCVARMAQETAEGQALELDWIRHVEWQLGDGDYVRMVEQKTAFYSFITPLQVGAIVAGAASGVLDLFEELGVHLGVAFQIQDDVLNLRSDDDSGYGKEAAGDLWEGKHTLILLHAMRAASSEERARALAILAKPRPPSASRSGDAHLALQDALRARIDALRASGDLTRAGAEVLESLLGGMPGSERWKTDGDVAFLRGLIERSGSLDYAAAVAVRYARTARAALGRVAHDMAASVHRDFLFGVLDFVVEREW